MVSLLCHGSFYCLVNSILIGSRLSYCAKYTTTLACMYFHILPSIIREHFALHLEHAPDRQSVAIGCCVRCEKAHKRFAITDLIDVRGSCGVYS